MVFVSSSEAGFLTVLVEISPPQLPPPKVELILTVLALISTAFGPIYVKEKLILPVLADATTSVASPTMLPPLNSSWFGTKY